jgi:hypothetical protein
VDSTEENDGDSEQTSAGVEEEENMQMQLENSDGTVKKMHKAKVEIGIMNQVFTNLYKLIFILLFKGRNYADCAKFGTRN